VNFVGDWFSSSLDCPLCNDDDVSTDSLSTGFYTSEQSALQRVMTLRRLLSNMECQAQTPRSIFYASEKKHCHNLLSLSLYTYISSIMFEPHLNGFDNDRSGDNNSSLLEELDKIAPIQRFDAFPKVCPPKSAG
jgi:hypothetical protein